MKKANEVIFTRKKEFLSTSCDPEILVFIIGHTASLRSSVCVKRENGFICMNLPTSEPSLILQSRISRFRYFFSELSVLIYISVIPFVASLYGEDIFINYTSGKYKHCKPL